MDGGEEGVYVGVGLGEEGESFAVRRRFYLPGRMKTTKEKQTEKSDS
jgi:hypothetical protein